MTPVAAALLDLLSLAETPLYSAYSALNRDFGSRMTLRAFLDFIRREISREEVRLWQVNLDSGARTEFFDVPTELEDRYEELGAELDDAYDPFGYSLAVGRKAPMRPDAGWEADLDFRTGTYAIVLIDDSEPDHAVSELESLFPGSTFRVVGETRSGDRRVISGVIESMSGDG